MSAARLLSATTPLTTEIVRFDITSTRGASGLKRGAAGLAGISGKRAAEDEAGSHATEQSATDSLPLVGRPARRS